VGQVLKLEHRVAQLQIGSVAKQLPDCPSFDPENFFPNFQYLHSWVVAQYRFDLLAKSRRHHHHFNHVLHSKL